MDLAGRMNKNMAGNDNISMDMDEDGDMMIYVERRKF